MAKATVFACTDLAHFLEGSRCFCPSATPDLGAIPGFARYFDLQPMPALFRIVQDASPPLPEHISGLLQSFLQLCFQKDPSACYSREPLCRCAHAACLQPETLKPRNLQAPKR